MKTTVNLYQPEFRPQFRLLGLSFMLFSWFIVVFSSLAFYSYLSYEENKLLTVLQELERQQFKSSERLTELKKDIANLSLDPVLLDKINQQQSTINFKKQILQAVQGHERLTSNTFSNLMLDLAINNKENLWLTRIHINENVVVLEGGALDSTIVPQWVNSLSNTQFFKGQEFSETRLFRDQDEHLNFILSADKELHNEESLPNE